MDEDSISSQPPMEKEDEEDLNIMMGDEEYEQKMQMMAKYLRSKSLPVVCFPQFGMNRFLPLVPSSSVGMDSNPDAFPGSPVNSLEDESSSQHRIREFTEQKNVQQKHSAVMHHTIDPNDAIGRESKRRSEWRTLQQHYYPEGGWGWIVLFCAFLSHMLSTGIQLYISNFVHQKFHKGWLGAVSIGISLLFSPLWVSICKRKSTRLAAVFGGLVASLGCLFTSFASQFHQLFISYGAFLGIGVGLTRDASTLMVGQYFKRKRELVEIVVVSGSGFGILLLSVCIHMAISSFGWRLGLQAVTGLLFVTFFLGTCYRSASLYHPQRRAILHLKNQKRKVKDKEKRDDKPPFIDFTCLRSKTVRILLLSSAFTAFGIFTPMFSLASECNMEEANEEYSLVLLHIYMGGGWILGCLLFGLVVIQKNQDCRVSKQYLCQVGSILCGISMLALTSVQGYHGLVLFVWIYGIFLGGYMYSLKVYTYERVRARHFPRAWSFLQAAQAIPLFLGVPLTGYVNESTSSRMGYYISALSVVIGSACLFITDVRKRRLSRIRKSSQHSSMKTMETTDGGTSPTKLLMNNVPSTGKRLSFAFPMEQMSPSSRHESVEDDGIPPPDDINEPSIFVKELTCISEEGIADMDFQGMAYEDWAEYLGECITSCNKVENCLTSEYEPDYAVLMERRPRRWSGATTSRASHMIPTTSGSNLLESPRITSRLRPSRALFPNAKAFPVIDEDSV